MRMIKTFCETPVIVDDSDYPWLSQFRWRLNKGRVAYARTTVRVDGKKMSIPMHRMILGSHPDKQPDHINGNGLDNRRSNLRFATQNQNSYNSGPRGGTSQYKGVCWSKSTGKWQAEIRYDGEKKCLGWFSCEKNAARAYDRSAYEHHGEFARCNFPRSDYEVQYA